MIELACPESCSYLQEARATAVRRENELRVKETSKVNPRSLLLEDRALLALDAIERGIVNVQRGIGGVEFRDLNDAEILAAIETSIKNLETEESGLIYEHRAASSRIDQVSRRVRATLDEVTADVPAEARPRRSDIVKALNFARDAVKAHIERGGAGVTDSDSYIRYIALFYPWPEETTKPLIL